jgi:4-amino-4-deoxy-L-arabinose transferase-like glycosyltransferase
VDWDKNKSIIIMNIIETSTFLTISIALNFFLLIILLIANFRDIKNQFTEVKKKTWLLLLLIFLLGFFLRFTVPEYHKMYVDEQWNMEVGKNILEKGKVELCSYENYDKLSYITYMKTAGVPFIYSLSFLIFGVDNFVAIKTSAFLGSLSILLIFLVGFLLFKNEKVAIFSAMFLALFSLHIYWSASAETNIAFIFFILLTLLSFLLYFKVDNFRMELLAISSLTYTLQTRREALFLLPLIALFFLLFDENLKKKVKNKKFWIPFLICAMFFFAWLFQLQISSKFLISNYIDSREFLKNNPHGISFGLNYFQLERFKKNSFEYSKNLLLGYYFPLVISILIIIGLLDFSKKKELIFSLSLFLIFFLPFMFYDATQNRLLLPSFLGIVFLSSLGATLLLDKILEFKYGNFLSISLITLLLLSFFPSIREVYSYKLPEKILETKIPEAIEKNLSENCIIIAPLPEIFTATTKIKAISLEKIIKNPEILSQMKNKTSCVLFFEGMLCQEEYKFSPWNFKENAEENYKNLLIKQRGQLERECKIIKEKYFLAPYLNFTSNKATFTFYKFLA